MDFTILFDKDNRRLAENGKTAFSNVLYIPPGKVALLSMYNMIAGTEVRTDPQTGKKTIVSKDCVVVHKISYGRTDPLVIKAKCHEHVDVASEVAKLVAKRRVFFEPVLQDGCPWVLDACHNFALLPVPGFFMLEFTDPAQFDTAYVEYALLDTRDTITIPDAFKLGFKK